MRGTSTVFCTSGLLAFVTASRHVRPRLDQEVEPVALPPFSARWWWWEHINERVNVLRVWNLDSLLLNRGDVHLQQHRHVDNFVNELHLGYLDILWHFQEELRVEVDMVEGTRRRRLLTKAGTRSTTESSAKEGR